MIIDNFFLELMHGLQVLAGDFFTPFFHFITMLGEKGFIFLLVSFILCLRKKTRWVGVTAIIAIAMSWVFSSGVLKHIFMRTRPYLSPSNVFYKYWIDAGSYPETNFSFPSGHVTGCTAFFVSLLITYKKNYRKVISIIGIIFIILMTFSRMYFMHHYFTDCIGGFLLGIIGAFISKMIVKLILKALKLFEDKKLVSFILNFDILGKFYD